MMPAKYNAVIIRAPVLGKNAAQKTAYMGIFAEQLINGIKRIVIFRSLSEGSVRVAMMAGTLHPKPISIGTMLRPEMPILRSSLSMINAMRAI